MAVIFRWVIPGLIALALSPDIYGADPVEHRKLLSKYYRLQKPGGAGPYPAVMLVSGCSGFEARFAKAQYDAVQKRLVGLGFVTLRVDYLAVRKASSCWPDVSTEDVARDIRFAADYLRRQPFVKKGALNLMGWSWGGAGSLRALGRSGDQEPAHVDSVVVYYPACKRVGKWDSNVPVLVLYGAIDNVAPLRNCKTLFKDLPRRDRVTVKVYPDAHHAFDNSELPPKMQYQFGTLGYNAAAARSAWADLTTFLRR